MLNLFGKRWRVLLVLPAGFLVLASCTRNSGTELSYLEQLYIGDDCLPPGAIELLPRLDASDFTIASNVTPAFSIFAGVGPDFTISLGERPRDAFYVASEMMQAQECDRYKLFGVRTQHPDSVEVLPVENWPALAGVDAVRALGELEDECVGLPTELAIARYATPEAGYLPGDTSVVPDVLGGCELVSQSLTYGLRIRAPDGELIISNIFGEVFVTE